MKTKQILFKTLRRAQREAFHTALSDDTPYAVYTVGRNYGVGRMIYNSKRAMHIPGVSKSRIVWDTRG